MPRGSALVGDTARPASPPKTTVYGANQHSVAIAHLDTDEWPQIPEDGNWGAGVKIRYRKADAADLSWESAWTMAVQADAAGWGGGWVEEA
ncbi:hypothetical protein [Brachybacterium huguangmaarense]